MTDADFALLRQAVEARARRDRIGYGTFDEAAEAFRPRPACPRCGSGRAARDGRTPAGHRRFRCPDCRARFGALSGTIFENCKKDFATRVRFVEPMTWSVPVEAAAELCGVTHQTAFEWRRRVFATVRGCRDRIVPGGRVWIDEAYVNDTDLSKGCGRARKRGPSKEKLRIAIAIDASKTPVAFVCGHGKPSTKRIRRAGEPPGGGRHGRARQGARPQRSHRRQGVRLGGLQGGRGRPGLPRGHGDGEQPELVAEALPLAIHGHGPGEPPVLPGLVRLPVPRAPGAGQVAQDCKGGSPSDHGRRDLPHVGEHAGPPHF